MEIFFPDVFWRNYPSNIRILHYLIKVVHLLLKFGLYVYVINKCTFVAHFIWSMRFRRDFEFHFIFFEFLQFFELISQLLDFVPTKVHRKQIALNRGTH